MTMGRIFQGLLIIAAILCSPLWCIADDASVNASLNNSASENTSTQASMLLTPVRCVALHQGQVCYQNVQISWSSAQAGNYCVYIDNQQQPLRCWQGQAQGSYAYEFASAQSQLLQLKNTQLQVVAQVTMEVAWVYKSNTRRKTHWRLF